MEKDLEFVYYPIIGRIESEIDCNLVFFNLRIAEFKVEVANEFENGRIGCNLIPNNDVAIELAKTEQRFTECMLLHLEDNVLIGDLFPKITLYLNSKDCIDYCKIIIEQFDKTKEIINEAISCMSNNKYELNLLRINNFKK